MIDIVTFAPPVGSLNVAPCVGPAAATGPAASGLTASIATTASAIASVIRRRGMVPPPSASVA